jgi:hypothetical protein
MKFSILKFFSWDLLPKFPFFLLIFQLGGFTISQSPVQMLRPGCICGLHSALGHNPACKCNCSMHDHKAGNSLNNPGHVSHGKKKAKIIKSCHKSEKQIPLRIMDDNKYFSPFQIGFHAEILISVILTNLDDFHSQEIYLFPEKPS